MLTLYLDAGHTATDPGAVAGPLREHTIASKVVARTAEILHPQGVEVVVTPDTLTYYQVQEWVLADAKARNRTGAFVAYHHNAGGGAYGMVCYGWASERGHALGLHLRLSLEAHCPEVKPWNLQALPDAGYPRAEGTIKVITASPLQVCAVLIEAAFLDQPKHAAMFTPDGIERQAQGVADGVVRWAK